MLQETPLHEVADTVGVVLTLPALMTLVSIIWFAAKVKNAAENTANALKETTDRITKILDKHEELLTDQGEKVAILWDGHERRHGVPDRRQNS